MYEILEKAQELSGKWRIRAIISADESIFLWFDIEPSQEDIDRIIDNQLRQRILDNTVVQSTVLSCTSWQFRKALNQLGLRNAVEEAITSCNDQNIKDGWEYTTIFERYNPLVIAFGQQLSQTDIEMDTLFNLARTL